MTMKSDPIPQGHPADSTATGVHNPAASQSPVTERAEPAQLDHLPLAAGNVSDAVASRPDVWESVQVHPTEDPGIALQRRELFDQWLHCDMQPSEDEAKAHTVAWWDSVLNAHKWCAMRRVLPLDAAMLLSRFNPVSDDDVAGWLDSNTLETTAEDHRLLLKRCREIGGTRPLSEWYRLVTEAGYKVNSWLQEYIDAGGTWLVGEAAPESPDAAADTATIIAPITVVLESTHVTMVHSPLVEQVGAGGQEQVGDTASSTAADAEPESPDSNPETAPAPASPALVAPTKRSAMVNMYEHCWPTISSDIGDAYRNGLSDARLGKRGWDQSQALKWARTNGKLTSNFSTSAHRTPPSPLPSAENLVVSASGWAKKV